MSFTISKLRSKKITLVKRLGYVFVAIAALGSILLFETQNSTAAPGPISGTVFNDVNANGVKDAGEGAFPSLAIVNLYNSSGTYIKSRTSDSSGNFSFSGLSAGTYYFSLYNTTRASVLNSPPGLVDNINVKVEQTYGSVGSGAGAGSGPVCVGAAPTYGAKANYTTNPSEWTVGAQNGTSSGQCFGGRKADMTNTVLSALTPLAYPASTDFTTGNAGLNTQKSVSKVVLTTNGGVSNVDFGASTDVVTNTDASGQGSLAQFITNANNILGTRTMRFIPSAQPNQTSGSNKWWQINQGSTALPALIDTNTTIDGRAWNNTDGVTQLDTNPGVISGATVGTVNYPIADYKKPELEIVGDARASGGTALLTVTANNSTIANLGLNSTSNYPSTASSFILQNSGIDISVKDNLMGVNVATGANYATRPQNTIQINYGLALNTSGSLRHNYMSSNDARGMSLVNTVTLTAGDWAIEENDGPSAGVVFGAGTARISVRHNNMPNAWLDAAAVIGASGGYHTLTENTISGGSGVMALGGPQNRITKNKIQNATGSNPGVSVGNLSTGNYISQNSFSGNGGNSIDLNTDGVSENALLGCITLSPELLSLANVGQARPTLSNAKLNGSTLSVDIGYCGIGIYNVEIYKASPGAGDSNAGEGQQYLGTFTSLSLLNGVLANQTMTVSGVQPGDALTAIVVDAIAGNTSEFGPNTTVSSPPAAPTTAPDLAASSDSGTSNTDNLTSTKKPTFTGSCTNGETVTLYIDDVAVTPTQVCSGGTYSITVDATIADGAHTITSTFKNATGESTKSPGLAFTIDSTAPTVLSAPDMTNATDTGSSNTDNITSNNTPTFSGTCADGDTVTLYIDNTLAGTQLCSGGTYTITPSSAISNGNHTVSVSATDNAGNESAKSSTLAITIDTSAPAKPTISSPSNNANVNDATPTITGTGENGATVTVKDSDGTVLCTTTVANGTWGCDTLTLSEGTHTLNVQQTDAAGNVSAAAALTLSIDTIAPNAPIVTAPGNGSATNDATPTISGTGDANSSVTLVINGGSPIVVQTDGSGNWSYAPTTDQTDGDYSVVVSQKDAAGNTSSTTSFTYTVDTVRPSVTVNKKVGQPDPTTSNSATFTISFSEPIDESTLTISDISVGSSPTSLAAVASSITKINDTTWEVVITGMPNHTTVSANLAADAVRDRAGNTTTASTSTDNSVLYEVNSPNVTKQISNDATPTIDGECIGNHQLELTVNNQTYQLACSSDAWTFTIPSSLPDNTYNVVIKDTTAGLTNPEANQAAALVIDTVRPSATINQASGQSDPTNSNEARFDATFSEPILASSFTAADVTAANTNGAVAVTQIDATTWRITITNMTSGDTPTVSLNAGVIEDVAGNTNTASTSIDNSVTFDNTAPTKPVITTPSDQTTSSNSSLTIKGSGETNTRLTLFVDNTQITCAEGDPVTVANNAWECTPTTPFAEGAHTVTAKLTDAANNTSDISSEIAFTIDTTAPGTLEIPALQSSSDTGASQTDGITSQTKPTITGTCSGSDTVKLYDGATLIGSVNCLSNTYSITLAIALSEGEHAITATATDAAGNISPASPTLVVTIDTTAPTAASITAPANSTITNNTNPVISGTGESGATVSVSSNNSVIECQESPVIVSGEGTWSCTPTVSLADGQHSITVKQTDAAGNQSNTSATINITIDTTAPSALAAPVLVAGDDSGMSNSDTITNVTQPAFSGSCQNDTVIKLYVNSVFSSQINCNNGTFSLPPANSLAEGSYEIQVAASDAAGNTSTISPALTIIIDTTAPATPQPPTMTAASDSGSSNSDRITNDTTPIFSGSCTTGNEVTLYINGAASGQGTCAGNATYAITPTTALASGQYQITTSETDIAGNQSSQSSSTTITIDIAAPATPSITTPANNTTTNNASLVIAGSGESDNDVIVLVDGNEVACTEGSVRTVDTTWTCTLQSALSDGSHAISIQLRDTAGNVSTNAPTHTVIVDTTAPNTLNAPDLVAASDSGTSDTDNLTNDKTPTLRGDCTNGDTIRLFVDAVEHSNTTCQNGSYELTTAMDLSDGTHAFTVTATDPAGNASAASVALEVTIVTTKPTVSTTDLVAASDSGRLNDDNITNDTTPTFSGDCANGNTITLFVNGTAGPTATCTSNNYTLTAATLSDSEHNIAITSTDTAGNESNQSPILTVTIDTAAPAKPQITSPQDSTTTSTTPTIAGTAENAAIIVVSLDSQQKACVDAPIQTTNGGWSCTLTASLADGTYQTQATATDIAGNTSPLSDTVSFTIDTVIPPTPTAPNMTPGSDSGGSNTDNITNDQRPLFTGSCTNNYRVTLFIDNNQEDSVICSNGTYSLRSTSFLGQGSHSVTIKTTDPAGNVSSMSAPLTITVMIETPPAPADPDLAASSDSGNSNTDNITNDSSPHFTGSCIDTMIVRLWVDENMYGQTTCANSTYTIQSSTPLTDGTHQVRVQYVDAAGNNGDKSDAMSITIDTTAPTSPTVTNPTDGSTTTDNTPQFQGGGENGATPHITIGSTAPTCDANSTPVVVNNQWNCTPTSSIPDGTHTVTTTQSDPAGNTSSPTVSTFTVNAAAPATPAAPDLVAASDTGVSNSDNYTNDTTPSFSGACANGTQMKLYAGATLVAETPCTNSTYTLTSQTLVDGSYVMTITATNASNVASSASSGLTITIDTAVAQAPGTPDMTSATDSGLSNSDNVTNNGQPHFSGSCNPNGLAIEMRLNSSVVGQATCSNGSYDITPTVSLSEGTHQITVNSVSQSGVNSANSTALTITVDKTTPQPPVIAVPSNGALLNNNKPTISGTGETGGLLQVYINDSLITCSQAAQIIVSGGVWTCTPTNSLPEGFNTIKTAQTDIAGNTSGYSTVKTVLIDTTPPARPGRPDLTANSDSGVSNTDNVTNITTPVFTGSCTVGETVRLRLNTVVVAQAVCTSGSYTLATPTALASGTHNFSVVTVDPAGNVSPVSLSLTITIATSAPKPSLPDLHVDSDSGLSGTDNITNVTRPTITGTCNQNETVRIYIDNVFQRSVPCVPPFYAQPLDQLAPGNHLVTMEVIDIAGNLSPVSDALTITIDTMAPGNPTVTTPASGTTPTVTSASYQTSGTTEPNAQIVVWEGSTKKCESIASASGAWTCILTNLTNGNHTYTFSANDVAGNAGAHIITRSIIVNR